MGEAILTRKGGMNLDAIIEEYYAYAGEEISAGSFVEFIEGTASREYVGESTIKSANSNLTGTDKEKLKPAILNENLVILSTSTYLQSIIISGNNVTAGPTLSIKSQTYDEYQYYRLGIHRISDNSFVFFYTGSDHTNNPTRLLANLYTVDASGNFNLSSENSLFSPSNTFRNSGLLSLGDNRFLAIFNGAYENYTTMNRKFVIFELSGVNISLVSETTITNNNGEILYFDFISENRVLYVYKDFRQIKAMIINIDGDNIIENSQYTLASIDYQDYCSAVVNDEGTKIAVLVNNKTMYYSSISLENTISDIISQKLSIPTQVTPRCDIYMSKINNNKFMVSIATEYSDTSSISRRYYVSIYTIDWVANNTTVGTYLELNSYEAPVAEISKYKKNRYLAKLSSYSNYTIKYQLIGANGDIANASIYDYITEMQVKNATTKNKINGLSKTSGKGGDSEGHNEIVKIYTLSN